MNKFEFQYFKSHVKEVDLYLDAMAISTDDYDYLIFSECKNKDQIHISGIMLAHLLKGCCHNECIYVEDFFGKNGVIGIAYHA